MQLARALILLLSFIITPCHAVSEAYPFDDSKNAERFNQLTKDFRCVTCQNQNLAESNAPIAESMRDAIYQQIKAGKKDEEVEQFLVARYGDFVLYKPPFKQETLILWLAPLIFLIIGLIFAFRSFKSDPQADD